LKLKRYFSLPDKALVKQAPQPMQHLVIAEAARVRGGEIVYYTMEDPFTLSSQEVFLSKVKEEPSINGFIFFTLDQFGYSGQLNISLVEWVLRQGYELHFARENISLLDAADLDRQFPLLFTQSYVDKRDTDHSFLAQALRGMDRC